MKEARRIHESLSSVKADTFATLVSRSMQHGRRATLHDGTRVRKSRGGRSQQTCRARATSNQALVDVIIARKRAPSHRVFVAQVFGRNMCGKRRRRHRFSAFWLRSSVVLLIHECDPPAYLNDPVIPSQSPFIHLSNPSEVDSAFPGQFEPIVVGPHTVNNEPVVSPPSPTTEKDPVEPIPEFHARWSLFYSGHSSWQEFSDCSKNVPAPPRPNCPSARPANNNRQPIGYNPVEARKIQTRYRISKKRAARNIIDSKPSYSGSVDDANVFFTSVFGTRSCDMDNLKAGLSDFVPSGPTNDSLGAATTPKEAEKKLKSLSNSAPGADRVEYRGICGIS